MPGEHAQVSDRGLGSIDISNIGSDRLDEIYAEADIPTEQPFGTESGEVNHSTGNLVTLSMETVENNNYRDNLENALSSSEESRYLNRVEFFEDNPPEFLQLPEEDEQETFDGETLEPQIVEAGRFRVGELDYFFVYLDTNTDDGNYGEGGLLIAQTPTTPGELGTFDFTESGEDYSLEEFGEDSAEDEIIPLGSPQEFVHVIDEDADGEQLRDGNSADVPTDWTEGEDYEVRQYGVYVDQPEGVVTRASFNVRAPSTDGQYSEKTDISGQGYILDSDGTKEETLMPGETFPVDIGVHLPNGIDHESIDSGQVTLNAEGYE